MGLVGRALARRPLAVRRQSPGTVRAAVRAWGAALAALCGAGLLVGIPSQFVPDRLEPAVGVGLLTLAARSAFRARRRGDRP